ncbi:MAG: DUF5318 family protein [Nitriliruptoraceae bacterium]
MRRSRIDYRMQRRAVIQAVTSGARDADGVRDAHPELVRAAKHLGRPSRDPCPLCDAELVHVHYAFERDRSRSPGGRAVAAESLAAAADRFGELQIYVVEVCTACHWHHLVESYVLAADSRGIHAG